MRATILSLLILISLAVTMRAYGFLESAANMAEMLVRPLSSADPSAGGALWFGGPFLVLFIVAGALWYIGVPLAASALAGCLGGWGLKQSRRPVSKRAGWICAALAAALATVLVVGVIQPDIVVTDRPGKKPKTPASVLAGLAVANAAVNVFVGILILRLTTSRVISSRLSFQEQRMTPGAQRRRSGPGSMKWKAQSIGKEPCLAFASFMPHLAVRAGLVSSVRGARI